MKKLLLGLGNYINILSKLTFLFIFLFVVYIFLEKKMITTSDILIVFSIILIQYALPPFISWIVNMKIKK
ncbi:hypothetical protein J4403_04265 [Candidatus Woesearchaeota archaeon]|nr:hypothetical protein [Candidatus Woesearchaeota archaeon]